MDENNQNMEYAENTDFTQNAEYNQNSDYIQNTEYNPGTEYEQTTEYSQDETYGGNPEYSLEYGYVNPERNLYGEEERDTVMAVLSLVFGVIGIVTSVAFIGLSFDIAAIVLAIVVLKRRYFGKGLAIAGLVTAGIGVLLSAAVIVCIVVFARDLTGEILSTVVDYYSYYSEGGMGEDEYYDEYFDEYSDEYSDEYYDESLDESSEVYYDDSFTDEGYMDEEAVEDIPKRDILNKSMKKGNIGSSVTYEISENELYADSEEYLTEEDISEDESEEEYYDGEELLDDIGEPLLAEQ